MDAATLQGLIVPQLTKAGIDVNSTIVKNVLSTLLPALAAVNLSLLTPLLSEVLALSGPSGSIDLSAINSTVVTQLITTVQPIVHEIPYNTTAALIEIVAGGLVNSTAASNATAAPVNATSAAATQQLLTGAVLPGLTNTPANVTTPLIHDLFGAVAYIPSSMAVPFTQDILLQLGSLVSSSNSTSTESTISSALAGVNITSIESLAFSLVPGIISTPENYTLTILKNVEDAVTGLPTNESVPLLRNAAGLITSIPKNSSSTLMTSIDGLMFPASGQVTNVTKALMSFGLTALLLGNYDAAPGTGIVKLNSQIKSVLGPDLPQPLVDYAVSTQWNIFGGYPTHKDVVPSAILLAVFAVFAICHLTIFVINTSRGHHFWLSLGWVFYCIMRVIGWALRIAWSHDETLIQLGIADEVFLIVSSIVLITSNLILSQRIFTWHHPVGGSTKFFWAFMYAVYFFVFAVIAMTIACQCIPYLHFLSEANYRRYKKVCQASSILVCLYSLLAVSLVGLTFLFKATEKDKNAFTFQPWWIKSFSPFYFVEKNAAHEAEKQFVSKNVDQKDAIRVIAATHHNAAYEVEGLTTERGDNRHNFSLFLIIISSVFLLVGAILRAITFFENNNAANASNICKPVVMYIMWGGLEGIINILYIVGRVDLRFYRPDKISKKLVEEAVAAKANHPVESTDEEKEKSLN